MGNTQQQHEIFDAHRYARPGITVDEVLGLKNVFDQLEPKNGIIETGYLRKLYRESHDASALDLEIGNRQVLTFDQFFEIMGKQIIQKKRQFQGEVQFEDNSEDVVCLFCPQSMPKSKFQS